MDELKIVKGTLEQYNAKLAAVATADEATKKIHSNTIYFIMDVHRIYIGDTEFIRPVSSDGSLVFL